MSQQKIAENLPTFRRVDPPRTYIPQKVLMIQKKLMIGSPKVVGLCNKKQNTQLKTKNRKTMRYLHHLTGWLTFENIHTLKKKQAKTVTIIMNNYSKKRKKRTGFHSFTLQNFKSRLIKRDFRRLQQQTTIKILKKRLFQVLLPCQT